MLGLFATVRSWFFEILKDTVSIYCRGGSQSFCATWGSLEVPALSRLKRAARWVIYFVLVFSGFFLLRAFTPGIVEARPGETPPPRLPTPPNSSSWSNMRVEDLPLPLLIIGFGACCWLTVATLDALRLYIYPGSFPPNLPKGTGQQVDNLLVITKKGLKKASKKSVRKAPEERPKGKREIYDNVAETPKELKEEIRTYVSESTPVVEETKEVAVKTQDFVVEMLPNPLPNSEFSCEYCVNATKLPVYELDLEYNPSFYLIVFMRLLARLIRWGDNGFPLPVRLTTYLINPVRNFSNYLLAFLRGQFKVSIWELLCETLTVVRNIVFLIIIVVSLSLV